MPQADSVWCAVGGKADDAAYISAAMITVFDLPQQMLLTNFEYFAKTSVLTFQAELSTKFIGTRRKLTAQFCESFWLVIQEMWWQTILCELPARLAGHVRIHSTLSEGDIGLERLQGRRGRYLELG